MQKIIIFGSGAGSNARNLIEHFKEDSEVEIVALVSDKPRRGFLDISYDYRINLEIIKGHELSDPKWIAHLKVMYRPDLIVLAGFLKLIPKPFIDAFLGRILNLHPSLLPKFGGKGMYGMHVHKAVSEAGETESGITVHWVNEHYDEGNIIFQAPCSIIPHEAPELIAQKVHALEYRFLPAVIDDIIKS
jgi:phosphoribosylglycinamide formyltransferase-1